MSRIWPPPAAVSGTSTPWPKAGRGRGSAKPAKRSTGHIACQAKPPRQTTTRSDPATRPNSAESQGAQVSRSVTVGLFAGGAHRTAATILAPISRWPSPALTDVGWAASPHRYSDANRTSPLRSPVKIRPVRLPPWAAGARPAISTAGRSSPQPGMGRPQYRSPRVDGRLTMATCSRHSTSRGQAWQTDCRATSSARVPAPAASARTSAASCATGVEAAAGSPGQPVPGGTRRPDMPSAGPDTGSAPDAGSALDAGSGPGDGSGAGDGPVPDAGSGAGTGAAQRQRPRDAVQDVVLAGQHLGEPEPGRDRLQHQRPAADHVHPARVHHAQPRPFGLRHRQQPGRLLTYLTGPDPGVMDPVGVVGV